jgi:formamidopyrimidine-DNA glycosylase
MPELPDVAGFKTYFDATALHQRIHRTHVTDDRVLENGLTPAGLGRRLKACAFDGTHRHGKLLFAQIDGEGWLVMHFGMTGHLKYYESTDDQPDHARVIFDFENGNHLAFVCQRMFGRIDLADDLDHYLEQRDVGPDALDEALDRERFRGLLAGRRGAVKSTLMNQSIIAGVGNVYADEILFQARIHPETAVNALGEAQLDALYRTMRRVMRVGARHGGHVPDYPDGYLLKARDAGKCPNCGGGLEQADVAGRTTWYCPRCQG